MENVFLIGPRASGKSSIGLNLAQKINYSFVDMDQLFVDTHKIEIADLVKEKGWPLFRKYESELLEQISREPGPRVLATGGGIVLAGANRGLMRRIGLVFYLAVPAEELARRLAADPKAGQRPSLTGRGLLEEAAAVLAEREELYRQTAHYVINAAEPMEMALCEIITILNDARENVWKK